jgi:hypothetical protein
MAAGDAMIFLSLILLFASSNGLLLSNIEFSFKCKALQKIQFATNNFGSWPTSSLDESRRRNRLSKSKLWSSKESIQAEGSGSPCRIKVIGVGGGGGNAVNRMIESSTGVAGVELWVANTDAQALARNLAPNKLNIGVTTSRYGAIQDSHV